MCTIVLSTTYYSIQSQIHTKRPVKTDEIVSIRTHAPRDIARQKEPNLNRHKKNVFCRHSIPTIGFTLSFCWRKVVGLHDFLSVFILLLSTTATIWNFYCAYAVNQMALMVWRVSAYCVHVHVCELWVDEKYTVEGVRRNVVIFHATAPIHECVDCGIEIPQTHVVLYECDVDVLFQNNNNNRCFLNIIDTSKQHFSAIILYYW